MIFQVFIFHFHDFGVPRSLESRHLLFGDIAVCGILLVCIGPVQKEQFLHLPNFGLKDDRSGNAKRSRSTDWPGQVQRDLWLSRRSRCTRPGQSVDLSDLRPRCFCVWSHQDLTAASQSSLCQVFFTWSIPHWFTMGTSELARNPFDNGRFTNCWNFWCQPRWPAARGLLLCHAMRSQPMFACHKAAVCHKCILYTSVGMHLTHAFYKLALFKAVFNVFGPNKA